MIFGTYPCLVLAKVKCVNVGRRSRDGCLVMELSQPLQVIVAMSESNSWENVW